ncbi:MAG: heavy-metal-associated domain-containing protein [Flavobacteriaceae bacterium]|nr:heavy-metal-associated domain-containing protein [Flavobacteriaceae bacterium]
MTKTYTVSNIMCTGCVNHVKDQIEKHPDVTLVGMSKIKLMYILRKPKEIAISMDREIPIAELQEFLDKDSEYAGRYSIS